MEHPLRSPWTSSGTDLNGLIPHPPANPIALRGKNPRLRRYTASFPPLS